MEALDFLKQSDGVGKFIAVLLLLMSLASWVVIFWKAWVIKRAVPDVARSIASFWQAADVSQGRTSVSALDREQLVLPLIDAAQINAHGMLRGTLAGAGDASQQLTRLLRDALHGVVVETAVWPDLARHGGSDRAFVGLLGTVWGIYHALIGLVGAGQVTIDKIAGPVVRR